MANVATHKLDVLPLVQQHGELEEDEGGDDVAPHERRQDHDDHREQLLMGKEGLKDSSGLLLESYHDGWALEKACPVFCTSMRAVKSLGYAFDALL